MAKTLTNPNAWTTFQAVDVEEWSLTWASSHIVLCCLSMGKVEGISDIRWTLELRLSRGISDALTLKRRNVRFGWINKINHHKFWSLHFQSFASEKEGGLARCQVLINDNLTGSAEYPCEYCGYSDFLESVLQVIWCHCWIYSSWLFGPRDISIIVKCQIFEDIELRECRMIVRNLHRERNETAASGTGNLYST
jgi:hypothetical protein